MANVLITYISLLNENGIPQKYISFLDEKNGTEEIWGRLTNEAGTKAIMKYLTGKGQSLDRIICLCSKEAINNIIDFKNEKNKEFPEEPPSAKSYDYFKNSIRKYARQNKLKTGRSFFKRIKISSDSGKIDGRRKTTLRYVLPKIFNEIDFETGDNIYIDTTGGLRDAVINLQLIMTILKNSGITIQKMVYSSFGKVNEIRSLDEISSYYEILDGVNEFVSSGTSGKLKKFIDNNSIQNEQLRDLVTEMGEFANCLQLCNTESLNDVIGRVNTAVVNFENLKKPKAVEAVFQNILPVIKNKFIDSTSDYCSIIEWCLNNGLIQQALTIYIEKIPEMLLDQEKGLIGAEEPISQAEQEAKKNPLSKNVYSTVFYTKLMGCVNLNNESEKKNSHGVIEEIKLVIQNKIYNVRIPEVNEFSKAYQKLKREFGLLMTDAEGTNVYSKLKHQAYLFIKANRSKIKYGKEETMFNQFVNGLKKEQLIEIAGITDDEPEKDKINTIDKKIFSYQNINNELLSQSGFECRHLDELKPIMLDYILAKALRNQINHASDEENLTEEQKQFFKDRNYKVDLSVDNISEFLGESVKHVRDFMSLEP